MKMFQRCNNLENDNFDKLTSKMNILKIKGLIKRKNKEFYDLVTVLSLNNEELEEKIISKKENLKDNITLMKSIKDIMKNENKMFKEIKREKKIIIKIKGNIKRLSQNKNETMKKHKEESLNKYVQEDINDNDEHIDDIIDYMKKIKNIKFYGKIRKIKHKNSYDLFKEDISEYKKEPQNIKNVHKNYDSISKHKIGNKNMIEEKNYKLYEDNYPLEIKKKIIEKKKKKKSEMYEYEKRKKSINSSLDELQKLYDSKKKLNKKLLIPGNMENKLSRNDNIKIKNAKDIENNIKKKKSLKNKKILLNTGLDIEKDKLFYNSLLKCIKTNDKHVPLDNDFKKTNFLLKKRQKECSDELYIQQPLFYKNYFIKSNDNLQKNSKNKIKKKKKIRKNINKSYIHDSTEYHAIGNDKSNIYDETNFSTSNINDVENFIKTEKKKSKRYNKYSYLFPELEKCDYKNINDTNKSSQRKKHRSIIICNSNEKFSRDKHEKKSVKPKENFIRKEQNKNVSSYIYIPNLPNIKNISNFLFKNCIKNINEKSKIIKKKNVTNKKLNKKSYKTNKLMKKTNLISILSYHFNKNEKLTQKYTQNINKEHIINLNTVNINVKKSINEISKDPSLDYSKKYEFTNILKTNSKKTINDKMKNINQNQDLSSNELHLLLSQKKNNVSENNIVKKETGVIISPTIEKNEKECFSVLSDENSKISYEKSTNVLKGKGEISSISKRIVNDKIHSKNHNVGNQFLISKTNFLSTNNDIKSIYSSKRDTNNVQGIHHDNSKDKKNNDSFINQKKESQDLKGENIGENDALSNNFVRNNIETVTNFNTNNETKENSLKKNIEMEQINVKKNVYLNNENIKITLKEELLNKEKIDKSPINNFQNPKFSLVTNEKIINKNMFLEKKSENIPPNKLNNVDCTKNEITKKEKNDPFINKSKAITETKLLSTPFEKNVIKNQYKKLQDMKEYNNTENKTKQCLNMLDNKTNKEDIHVTNTNTYSNAHKNRNLEKEDLEKEISTLEKLEKDSNKIYPDDSLQKEKKLVYSNKNILLKQNKFSIKKEINVHKYNGNTKPDLFDENKSSIEKLKTNNEVKFNKLFKNVLNKNNIQLEKMSGVLLNKMNSSELEIKRNIDKKIPLNSALSNKSLEKTEKETINSKEECRNNLEEHKGYINEDKSNKCELNNQEIGVKTNQMNNKSLFINKNGYSKSSLVNVDQKETLKLFSKNISTMKSTVNIKNNKTIECIEELENNLNKKSVIKTIEMEKIKNLSKENKNDLDSTLDSRNSREFVLQAFSKNTIDNLSVESKHNPETNMLEKEMNTKPESMKKTFNVTDNLSSPTIINEMNDINKQKLESKKLQDISTMKLHSFASKIKLEKSNLFDTNKILSSLGVKYEKSNSKTQNKLLGFKNLSNKCSIKLTNKDVNENEKEENKNEEDSFKEKYEEKDVQLNKTVTQFKGLNIKNYNEKRNIKTSMSITNHPGKQFVLVKGNHNNEEKEEKKEEKEHREIDKPIIEKGSNKILLKDKESNIKNNQMKLCSNFLPHKKSFYIKNNNNYEENIKGRENNENEREQDKKKGKEETTEEIKEENKEKRIKEETVEKTKKEEIKENIEEKIKEETTEETKKEDIKENEEKKIIEEENKEETIKEEISKEETVKEEENKEETTKEEIKEEKSKEETIKGEIKEENKETIKEEIKEEENKNEIIKKEIKEEQSKEETVKDEIKEEKSKEETVKEEIKEEKSKEETVKEIKKEENKEETIKEENREDKIKEMEEDNEKKIRENIGDKEKEDIKNINPIIKIKSTKVLLKPKMCIINDNEKKSNIKNISFIKKFHNIKNLSTLKQFPSKKSIKRENNENDNILEDKLNINEDENKDCTNSKNFNVNNEKEKNYYKVKSLKLISSNRMDTHESTEGNTQSKLLLEEQNENVKSGSLTNGTFMNSTLGNLSKYNSNNTLKGTIEKKLLNFPQKVFNDASKKTLLKENNDINNFSKNNIFLPKIEGKNFAMSMNEKNIPNTKKILSCLKNSKNGLISKGKNVLPLTKENNFE
ncbi:conserved Plasmodium protein, unknown function [Plasmodium gallinaceum]|uniref:Uncharacterized protein n=1 Tax=Plasmodium gallinaceum TaxID=5849 RepID=A0A1J1GXR9_PLAGA|nr:conserved Plasmodium protein, unknown function [Plasmodium gallinaceum]CRG97280.1 conserved Plasmodium protein, unknown function [Plasmodium gallinaceum]